MVKTFNLLITPEEIALYTIVEGDPPIVRFRKSVVGAPKVPGENYYGDLLREKLGEVLVVRSALHVSGSCKANPKKPTSTCYVKCSHGGLSTIVTYMTADLMANTELKVSAEVRCPECLGEIKTTTEISSATTAISSATTAISSTITSTPASSTVSNSSGTYSELQVSFLPPGPISETYKGVAAAMSAAVSRSFVACLSAEDPMIELDGKKVEFAQSMSEAFYEAVRGVPSVPGQTPSTSGSQAARPSQPGATLNANDVLFSGMALKMATQRGKRQQQTIGSGAEMTAPPAAKKTRGNKNKS